VRSFDSFLLKTFTNILNTDHVFIFLIPSCSTFTDPQRAMDSYDLALYNFTF